VIGKDDEGHYLQGLFRDKGIGTDGFLADETRPTTLKTRIIASHQQVVRVDREKRDWIGRHIEDRLFAICEELVAKVDMVVISDYSKGLAAPSLVKRIIELARIQDRPVVVDPKGRDYEKYAGASVLTPNRDEAANSVGYTYWTDAILREAALQALSRLKCQAVLITRSEEGMSLYEPGRVTHIPALPQEVFDVTGAGDTVLATFSLAMAAGADRLSAAHLANCSAGLVVSKLGTATVLPAELERRLSSYNPAVVEEELSEFAKVVVN
jgi:D-beta-D-heptose 7-phosphate kinase/D-beta-D-heptose 1-phosphate adenosyltransferase